MSSRIDPADIERPWVERYPPGVPVTYDYPSVPVTRFLDDAARDFPVATALRFDGRGRTWADVRDLVDRTAALLRDLGTGPGDRVAMVLPTVPAAVVTAFAVWRLGAVLCPLAPGRGVDRLGRRLRAVRPHVVVAGVADLDDVQSVRHTLTDLRHVVVTDADQWGRRASRTRSALASLTGRRRAPTPDDDVVVLDEVLRTGPVMIRQAPVEPDAPAVIVWTGRDRGAVLSHRNLVANAFQTRLWVPDIRAGHDVVLMTLPTWHAFGLTATMLAGTLAASTLVLLPRPDTDSILDAIEEEQPTIVPGTPRLFQQLVDAPGLGRRDLSSVRVAVAGGAALDPSVRHRFEAATGGRLRQAYGLTEASPVTHANPVYGRTVDGAVGLPVTDTVAVVVDPDDHDTALPYGEVGELLVNGPQVMLGWWRGPDAEPDGPGRWLTTGDLAVVDPDGTTRVVGRVEDAPLRDGRRIPAADVEDAVLEHPGVARAVVVGTGDGPDQVIHAVAVPRRRSGLTVEDLRVHLELRLEAGLVPDRIHLRDDLPTTSLGAVVRSRLRESLDVEAAGHRSSAGGRASTTATESAATETSAAAETAAAEDPTEDTGVEPRPRTRP